MLSIILSHHPPLPETEWRGADLVSNVSWKISFDKEVSINDESIEVFVCGVLQAALYLSLHSIRRPFYTYLNKLYWIESWAAVFTFQFSDF